MARRVGIGVMGMAMMRNVRDGLEVVGYDVAEKAEVLITSLPNVDAFEQVMAGRAASSRDWQRPWIRGPALN